MWLSADEQAIIQFLTHCGEAGASPREVCRKASTKDRLKEDERWALPLLGGLRDKRAIETTPAGNFRAIPDHAKKQKLGERTT